MREEGRNGRYGMGKEGGIKKGRDGEGMKERN